MLRYTSHTPVKDWRDLTLEEKIERRKQARALVTVVTPRAKAPLPVKPPALKARYNAHDAIQVALSKIKMKGTTELLSAAQRLALSATPPAAQPTPKPPVTAVTMNYTPPTITPKPLNITAPNRASLAVKEVHRTRAVHHLKDAKGYDARGQVIWEATGHDTQTVTFADGTKYKHWWDTKSSSWMTEIIGAK